MIETNIRIFPQGKDLYVPVRKLKAKGSHLSVDLLEKACSRYLQYYRLAAVPSPDESDTLLVASYKRVPSINLKDIEWELDVQDTGQKWERVIISSPLGKRVIPRFLERSLSATFERKGFWKLGNNRIWHESDPFLSKQGIDVFRRYSFAAIYLEDAGVGVAIDIETAFFSTKTLDYFFEKSIPTKEQSQREKDFEMLTNRQEGNKGTLWYNIGRWQSVCYFVDAPGVLCNDTATRLRIKGKSYDSLSHYYHETNPDMQFNENGQAVKVSFRNIVKPVWVAAEKLRVRVFNDYLPRRFKSIDKIKPKTRRKHIKSVWQKLGSSPLGTAFPILSNGFWCPDRNCVHQFVIPELNFGQGITLSSPEKTSPKHYRKHYNQRLALLNDAGCYHVPMDMPRKLYFAYPESLNERVCNRFAIDLVNLIEKWTCWSECTFEAAKPISYKNVFEAIDALKRVDSSGIMVFILDEKKETLTEVAFQLQDWRIQTVTQKSLNSHYSQLKEGFKKKSSKAGDLGRGARRWINYVSLNALQILQLMGAFPYVIEKMGDYEAQLFIDVGHDRRYYALSLLIARAKEKRPEFSIITDVPVKPDHQTEAINPKVLADSIEQIFDKALRGRFDPLSSLLILRDGRVVGNEVEGINNGISSAIANKKIDGDGVIARADFRKTSQKPIRFWYNNRKEQQVINALEGTSIILNKNLIAVAATGESTLSQGTARPYLVVSDNSRRDLIKAGEATFYGTQLNWSSPTVAQRLPLHAKLTDEELQEKAKRRIKRFR